MGPLRNDAGPLLFGDEGGAEWGRRGGVRNRLYFNILQFTLKIGSGAGTTAAAAAGFAGGVGKLRRSVG